MHHICQTSYEFNHGYELPMTKKCYSCLLLVVKQLDKEKNNNSSSTVSLSKNNVPPPSSSQSKYYSITSQNEDNNPPTIPTNVAPQRVDFVPPEDIRIDDGERLPSQNGFSKNSGIFGIKIIFMGKAVAADNTTTRAYGRIIEVPKYKYNQPDYVIEYDQSKVADPDDIKGYTTRIPGNKENKELLKRAFALADKEGYRFGGIKKKATKNNSKKQKAPQNETPNTILLPGILHENTLGAADVTELGNDSENSDNEISDEGSACDIDDSAFYHENSSDGEDNDEVENSFLSEEWAWNHFKELDDDGPIPGPEETDHYNGPHGLKPNVRGSFKTILRCIFQTSCMDRSFSRGSLMREQL